MKPTNTLQYKNYVCQVTFNNAKECLSGRVLGMPQIPVVSAQTVAGIKEAFQRAVDDYLLICKETGKKPAAAFTGNFTVRTMPAIHEALALYAAEQEVKLANVVHQAILEFMDNHNIVIPNREEN